MQRTSEPSTSVDARESLRLQGLANTFGFNEFAINSRQGPGENHQPYRSLKHRTGFSSAEGELASQISPKDLKKKWKVKQFSPEIRTTKSKSRPISINADFFGKHTSDDKFIKEIFAKGNQIQSFLFINSGFRREKQHVVQARFRALIKINADLSRI